MTSVTRRCDVQQIQYSFPPASPCAQSLFSAHSLTIPNVALHIAILRLCAVHTCCRIFGLGAFSHQSIQPELTLIERDSITKSSAFRQCRRNLRRCVLSISAQSRFRQLHLDSELAHTRHHPYLGIGGSSAHTHSIAQLSVSEGTL